MHGNIAFQRVLASVIERKIKLVGDVYYRLPITIKSHNCMSTTLERPWVRKLISTKGTSFSLFWFLRVVHVLAFPWPSLFVSFVMVPVVDFLLDFCFSFERE